MSDRDAVRLLNDAFRASFDPRLGRAVMTSGVDALPSDVKAMAIRRVATFSDFTPENDPYGEHDFGDFEVGGRRLFWKIEYYDAEMEAGSEDPADPSVTLRVLTVMLAEEY